MAEAAWTVDSRRSALVSRILLMGILAVQAGPQLRGRAFEDEALYIGAGHLELNHILHGAALPMNFNSYFSGYPGLYPVLAAAVDTHFGLTGVRLVSLVFMLSATAFLFGMTRRLFNARAALGASALFAVIQSTIFLGNFATFDAAAIFLLACAAWLVVRTQHTHPVAVLPAAFATALASAVKYAAGLYLPTLVVLAVLSTPPGHKVRAALRGVLFGLGAAAFLLVPAHASGALSGVSHTTTARAHGTASPVELFRMSAEWGGLVFLAAVGGAIAYIWRARLAETPWASGGSPGKARRALLGLTLCGTALLAPSYQSYLHTDISLFKHVGFGLLFAAPMAGIGLSRLVGAHFRHPQLGIMLFVVTMTCGLVQAHHEFTPPDSTRMVEAVQRLRTPNGRYLAEEYEIPAYYLRDSTQWSQWQSTFNIDYRAKDGRHLHGADGFRASVRDGWFSVIVLTGGVTPDTDNAILAALKGNPHYRLAATLPFRNQYGDSAYHVWAKK